VRKHEPARYDGDRLYERTPEARWTEPEERARSAARLRAYFAAATLDGR